MCPQGHMTCHLPAEPSIQPRSLTTAVTLFPRCLPVFMGMATVHDSGDQGHSKDSGGEHPEGRIPGVSPGESSYRLLCPPPAS